MQSIELSILMQKAGQRKAESGSRWGMAHGETAQYSSLHVLGATVLEDSMKGQVLVLCVGFP